MLGALVAERGGHEHRPRPGEARIDDVVAEPVRIAEWRTNTRCLMTSELENNAILAAMIESTHLQAPVTVRDAATVAVLRDRADGGLEVLLLRRHHEHVFGADADVFPGGAVDAADARVAGQPCVRGGGLVDAAWRMAVLRECFEEAGLLIGTSGARLDSGAVAAQRGALNAGDRDWSTVIEALGAQLDLHAPVAFACWTTPPGAPKRYATQFYAVAAPAWQIPRPDGRETVAAEWITPDRALAEAGRNQRWLMPPTRATLERLTRYADAATALAALARAD